MGSLMGYSCIHVYRLVCLCENAVSYNDNKHCLRVACKQYGKYLNTDVDFLAHKCLTSLANPTYLRGLC